MTGQAAMHDESPRYERPPLSLIEPNVTPYGVELYIGGMEAAGDVALLKRHGITTVVNCAVNLDINYAVQPFPDTPPGSLYGGGALRYYKIGLVDGDGNPETMMLGGFYVLRGAFAQVLPNRPTYPLRERGNVLVNCRAGRSRSVALVGLFLHVEMPEVYPTLEAAYAHVRGRRELRPDEWHETPKPMLAAAAARAADWIRRIDAAQDQKPA